MDGNSAPPPAPTPSSAPLKRRVSTPPVSSAAPDGCARHARPAVVLLLFSGETLTEYKATNAGTRGAGLDAEWYGTGTSKVLVAGQRLVNEMAAPQTQAVVRYSSATAAVLLALATGLAFSQGDTSSTSGTVLDPSDKPVAEAQIKLSSKSEGRLHRRRAPVATRLPRTEHRRHRRQCLHLPQHAVLAPHRSPQPH